MDGTRASNGESERLERLGAAAERAGYSMKVTHSENATEVSLLGAGGMLATKLVEMFEGAGYMRAAIEVYRRGDAPSLAVYAIRLEKDRS